ncbi:MAG: HlyC/CorC family transporter [Anaerolineae bacterium]|nr:HlyC/CorC family transporter [Anaerolineae bacterium]
METKVVSTETLILELALLVILIGINGFFVAVEFAVVASRRSRIEQLAPAGSRAGALVRNWVYDIHHKDRLIAAAQLGITVASLALGMVGESAFQSLLGTLFASFEGFSPAVENVIRALPVLLSLIIVSGLHVVFGEQIPKVAALRNPEGLAMRMALPMEWFRRVTGPFNSVLDAIAGGVLRLFGLEHDGGHSMLYSVEELKQIVRESEESGVLQNNESEILRAVFDLRETATRQVMVPRTEVVMVDVNASVADLVKLTADSPYTKFPIYEGDPDHVVGIVYLRDLVPMLVRKEEPPSLRDLMRDVLFVPEMLPIDVLLARFRAQRQHVAMVLDEYGGTAGIVTLEDILEELVGEVQDQFEEHEDPDIQRLPDGSCSVSGLMPISEVNTAFALSITDENYDTIAGYVMGQLGRIPRTGDVVEVDGVKIQVEEMDHLRIDRLTILSAKAASTLADSE